MEGIKCSWCDKLTHRQKMLVVLLVSLLLVVGVFSMGFSLGKKSNGFDRRGHFGKGMTGEMFQRGGCPMMNNWGGRQFGNKKTQNNFGGERNNNQVIPQNQTNSQVGQQKDEAIQQPEVNTNQQPVPAASLPVQQ